MDKERVLEANEHDRGKDIPFMRYRRITGYVSMLYQFNNGKRQEEKDRLTHFNKTSD